MPNRDLVARDTFARCGIRKVPRVAFRRDRKATVARCYVKSEKRDAQHQQRWRGLMSDGMDLIEIPGGHGDIIHNPYLGLWADKLQGWLDRAREGGSVAGNQRIERGSVSSPSAIRVNSADTVAAIELKTSRS